MNKTAIEGIVDRVYPQIVKDLGRSKKSTPKVEVHNNVLAMHSGIPDHPGGEEEHAEYDYKNNTIYLFKVALKTEQLVIQALLHEYTHACQDEKKYQAARAEGYANNPYEKAAHRAEKTWRKYMKKNESLNEIKKGDWIRSTYGDLGLVNKVKGQAAYVSFDGSRSFQPMRVADLKITKELHKGKVVYSEGKITEGSKANRWFDNLKYYYEKGLSSPDLKDPAEKKAYTKLAKQFFSKLTEGLDESAIPKLEKELEKLLLKYMKDNENSLPNIKQTVKLFPFSKFAKYYKTKKAAGLAEHQSEQISEDCGCGGASRKDASIQLAEYLKKQTIEEADYQGRDVKLNKPMQGDVKKFKVYVKNAKGNVVKVNFGQKGMVIKKDNPGAKKSFRARHKCDQSKPKTSAGYWSCKAW